MRGLFPSLASVGCRIKLEPGRQNVGVSEAKPAGWVLVHNPPFSC
jgi:hypothetical protein